MKLALWRVIAYISCASMKLLCTESFVHLLQTTFHLQSKSSITKAVAFPFKDASLGRTATHLLLPPRRLLHLFYHKHLLVLGLVQSLEQSNQLRGQALGWNNWGTVVVMSKTILGGGG